MIRGVMLLHSESVEMYLKSLAELGGAQSPVPIARVAERKGVTQVSANEMMKRLGDQGYVRHTPYKGVTLTRAGRGLAHSVIRRQRLWECFLVEQLNLDWARAHAVACELEHATAPDVVDALEEFLGHPTVCPHGNPIPDRNGEMEALPDTTLAALEPGQSARVLAIQADSTDVFEYLQKRGILPQQLVSVIETAPFDESLTLKIGEQDVTLGCKLAELVVVGLLDPAQEN